MTDVEAHSRYARFWDAYYGIVVAIVALGVLFGDDHPLGRRLTAVVAFAAMAVVHGAVGRRLTRRDPGTGPAVAVVFGQVVLFGVAEVAVPFATWALFAVIPLILQTVALRPAAAAILLANTVPVVADWIESGRLSGGQVAIGALSSATGVWLGFWTLRVIQQSVERGELIKELESTRAELARLSHTAGVAEERARLAGEIHDTLAQGFTSIITLLQAADPGLRDERLALAVRTAKENLAESRALIAALSPSALASGSLPKSVRRAAGRFTEESGVVAGFRTTGEERDLPTAVEVVLLRTAQEALTNIRRHAAAHEVAVLVAYAPDTVRLVVRDDGCGFTPGAADGFGLTGMRARAEQVNGTLTVHSDPETGTTIELEVPA